jgi:hypothetical protein
MGSKSDFWLSLHQLAADLQQEGTSDEERTHSLVTVLETHSAATIETYLENLTAVTRSLNHLLAKCRER